MRKGRRILTKIAGITVLSVLVLLGTSKFEFVKGISKAIFSQKENSPVIEKVKVEPVAVSSTSKSKTSGSVLGAAVPFWPIYDFDCNKYKGLNGCEIDTRAEKPTIILNSLQMVKEHHGLQIFDGVSTVAKLEVEKAVYSGTKPNKDPKLPPKTTVEWKKTGEKAEFPYCMQPVMPNSAAMISLGPISWPTTLMGQSLSTFRATDGNGEVQYAVVDPTGRLFNDFKPADIIKFCEADDKSRQYALRTIDTFNAKLPGYNEGDQMAYSILSLCNMTAPDGDKSSKVAREQVIKALWEAQDLNVKSVSALVEIENNFPGKIEVDDKFEVEINKKGIMGVALSGVDYMGMFGWQTTGARQARIPNSTAASKKLMDPFLAPGFSIAEQAKNPDIQDSNTESTTIISAGGLVRQMEVFKATVVGAISGGVYYMDESVASDTSNLSRLTWNPKNQKDDLFFCSSSEANAKRCPVIKAIGGCTSDKFAQTDIRLRQITLAAVNDTERYATVFDKDKVERTTTRAEDKYEKMLEAPNTLVDTASIDEILVASGKSSPICLASAASRIANQASKLSEQGMKDLKKRLESDEYTDQAILVSPVRVNYRSWAVYDVDQNAVKDCYAWAASHTQGGNSVGATRVNKGSCDAMDPLPKGYNVDRVEKWSPSNYVTRAALISFNIATYYKGLQNMSPTDYRLVNFREDLTARLAAQKIYALPEVKVDCGLNFNGILEYWMCRGDSDYKLLPKCQDGTAATDPLADEK